MQLDKINAVILVLLDLSLAFNTIDHAVHFRKMAKWCGLKGKVLKWMNSYLNDHKQKAVTDGEEWETKDIKYWVSHDSVLGP